MKKFIKLVTLFYQAKKMENEYNKLIKANDYNNSKYYDEINQNYKKVYEALEDMSIHLNGKTEELNKLLDNLRIIPLMTDYIRAFSSKNFIEALEKGKKIGSLSTNTFLSSLHCLDALNEIKASGNLTDQFKEDELVYKAGLFKEFNNPSSIGSIFKLRYNGAKMSLAYNSWLSEDLDESSRIFKEHLKSYSPKEIFENENIKRSPWFYKNISPKYIEFLNFCLDISTENEKKLCSM